ncbi:pirin family protein [Microaerobacter geothermalis]|uniref:pirin family protein n=1 Tax=Microaerobacter geothermalis TaxID=674972 RepID=UPI001F2B1EBA|nr:pirin family protein [Microaerobacter geothermalis]MCF6094251.1 pirin family protein [Microaerobacter geothermalis]
MIKIIPSEERYRAEHGWLTTRYSFSFAEYYDPNHLQFGPLRVFNDDIIQPGEGFGMHPHADMEIMTYVIEGELEHKDSMGNRGIIKAGEVQRMTAGTGIYHSEYNPSPNKEVHLLQIWFLPNQRGLTPSWEQKHFSKEQQRNQLLPVVAGKRLGEALIVNQDITVYLSHLEAGQQLVHKQEPGRRMYMFIIKGSAIINGAYQIKKGDSARITELSELNIKTEDGVEFMLMDLT